jgi:hypothetical protein
MKSLVYLLMISLIAGVTPVHALQADTVGQVQTLKGTASILRGSAVIPITVGTTLYPGDLVRTAKPGAVGIILTDDTTISLGPNSELTLKEYAYAPKEGKFALVAKMVKGTFVYLSGMIGKLAPNAVQLLIPDATIAVRGTKLLVEIEE